MLFALQMQKYDTYMPTDTHTHTVNDCHVIYCSFLSLTNLIVTLIPLLITPTVQQFQCFSAKVINNIFLQYLSGVLMIKLNTFLSIRTCNLE